MLKKLTKIMLCMMMSLSLITSQSYQVFAIDSRAGDFTTIKERLKEYFLGLDTIDDGAKVETCYVSKAEDYLKIMKDDGTFDDVDYASTTNANSGRAWDPYLALDRMQAIALAYHKDGNKLKGNSEVITKLNNAITHWQKVNPHSDNWWENEIGVQLRFARIALFMDGIMSDDAVNFMLESLIKKAPDCRGNSGQNYMWYTQNHIYYNLIKENATDLRKVIDTHLANCLTVQLDDTTKEAIQVDNSFYMHGKQFYSNGYGLSMFRDMSFWIYMLRGTQFALGQEVVDRMADFMLEGTSWTIRGDIIELYLGYRPYNHEVGYKNYASAYIEPLTRMRDSDPAHASQYQAILDSINGTGVSNGKNGNYYMWRSGYASHMRDGYGVNIKMDSKDLIGGEWRGSWPSGHPNYLSIYWTSSAASTIVVDGDEYTNVFPTYDWTHTPGTTTPTMMPTSHPSLGRFTNGTSFAIGANNGKYGSTAYKMSKYGTTVNKGYFFFDDEFVALGSGISSTNGNPIHTTLNQVEAEDLVVDGTAVSKGVGQSYTPKYIYNGKVGYIIPNNQKVKVSYDAQKDVPSLWSEEEKQNLSTDVFTAYFDHGVKPSQASYAYIVVPNKTQSEISNYANNIPVTIVSNTADVQAVRHDGLKQTQINFYKAGSLEYKSGYTVTVDKPCSLIIDESGAQRKITVAVDETNPQTGVAVVIENSGKKTTTGFMSKKAPYAGEPLTLVEGEDDRYDVSSTASGYPTSNISDNDESTYWQSQGNGSEYISVLTDSNNYIKDMEIVWGDKYATSYEIYGSTDGTNYQLITSVTDGKGGTESISIGGIYKFVKIAMKNSSGDCYQIKEVKFNESQLLSLKQPVEVSSTSATDTGNTKEKAVDGDASTRWSSKRETHDEWISVDLGRKSKIDAIEIKWEGACSNNYSIEVSDDNKTWTPVKEKLKADSSLLDQIVLDDTVEARYVKIHSIESKQKKYGISIYEFKVYGQYINSNISLNKEVNVSSAYNTNANTQGVNAVDGKADTKWSSARKASGFNTQEEWIVVDLGENAYIDGVKIDWEDGCSDNYRIEVSSDNKSWTTVEDNLKTTTETSPAKHHKDEIIFDEAVEGRYVRIYSSSSRTKYGINIWELEVLGAIKEAPSEPEVDYGENIALNKPSKASHEFKDTVDGNKTYYSSLAFDGLGAGEKVNNQQSRWVSDRKKLPGNVMNPDYNDDHYIQVDLGDFYDISKVVLSWEGAGASEYKLQVSLDGENWKDIEHITDGKGGIKESIFEDELIARYVKMKGIKAGSDYGYSLWEFEVYGEKAEAPQENIALNKPSKASSEYTNPYSNFLLESKYAFDGSVEDRGNSYQSRWVSHRQKDYPGEDVNSQWLQVDLEDVYNISKVVLDWEEACGKDYNIQVSLDGETWENISEVRGNSAPKDSKHNVREYTYDEDVLARYVRVLGIEPAGQYGYSLWEFEVYGELLEVSKDDLKEQLDVATHLDRSLYTANSLAVLDIAYNNAKAVYDKDVVTQEEVDEATKALADAIKSLERKPGIDVEPNEPAQPNKPNKPGQTDKPQVNPDSSAQTGDNTNIVLPFIVLVLVGFGMLVVRKKKEF